LWYIKDNLFMDVDVNIFIFINDNILL
jgi:hypothetical protein